MTHPRRDPASFRDEAGHIYHVGNRILRSVRGPAAEDYRFLRDSGTIDHLVKSGLLIESRDIDPAQLPGVVADCAIEHPRLPFVSYPYEWGYFGLRAGALHTLDLHLLALERGATLIDASAYNIQFVGPRPVFIDLLSLRRYQENDYWRAQRQFTEHFLNPLLLSAALGIHHNAWYRGSLDGISSRQITPLLPLTWKAKWPVLTNTVLPDLLQRRVDKLARSFEPRSLPTRGLPKPALISLLRQLRNFIAELKPRGRASLWSDYENQHSYGGDAFERKREILSAFIARTKCRTVWDMGCNTGLFAAAMLAAGARRVIGFDSDPVSVDCAFKRAKSQGLDFLPLVLDAANPSPPQGWNQAERLGLAERRGADGMVALAFVHHVAIGRNVPLPWVVNWLVSLAPTGLIEFVPKSDPMVERMLSLRSGETGEDYEEAVLRAGLEAHGRVVSRHVVSELGRVLYEYERRPGAASREDPAWFRLVVAGR